MDIKRTDEKLIKNIEEWNKQEKCIIADGRTELEKQQEEIIKGQQEELNKALKIIREPITVNSVEYKYFDIDNYNKLVTVIDYCHYLNNNVKPYVEAQDKEIERLNNIIKEVREYIEELAEDSGDIIGEIDRRRKVELLEILDKGENNEYKASKTNIN